MRPQAQGPINIHTTAPSKAKTVPNIHKSTDQQTFPQRIRKEVEGFCIMNHCPAWYLSETKGDTDLDLRDMQCSLDISERKWRLYYSVYDLRPLAVSSVGNGQGIA